MTAGQHEWETIDSARYMSIGALRTAWLISRCTRCGTKRTAAFGCAAYEPPGTPHPSVGQLEPPCAAGLP